MRDAGCDAGWMKWGWLPVLLALSGTVGCVVVSAKVPKRAAEVRVCTAPVPAAAEPVRYTPYAAALDRVLRQQAMVERELRRRDWDELRDELGDWQRYARRLAGEADTAHDPGALRDCCQELLAHIAILRTAAGRWDAAAARDVLVEVEPLLNRMSARFPLTEPVGITDARAEPCEPVVAP